MGGKEKPLSPRTDGELSEGNENEVKKGLIFIFAWVSSLALGLELASPFGEGMVLQRQMPLPVWGWGTPGEKVAVEFSGVKVSAKVDAAGRWQCELPAQKACAVPQTFTVSAGDETITYANVLVGEVWICCGQSNMQLGYGKVPEIQQLVADTIAAQRPVRTLNVKTMIALKEEERCLAAAWSLEPPPSAVAASFACLLQSTLNT